MTSTEPPAAEDLRCLDAGAGHTCTGTVEIRPALTDSGVGYPRCAGAWGERLALQERVRGDYPDSPIPPAWYTRQGGAAYAGERWDEDE